MRPSLRWSFSPCFAELLKSRRDIENLGDMFSKAAEGVNAKSAYHIQEVHPNPIGQNCNHVLLATCSKV